jgi:hypothetical protein
VKGASAKRRQAAAMATITLYIGVECDEWETHIRNAIQELAGT